MWWVGDQHTLNHTHTQADSPSNMPASQLAQRKTPGGGLAQDIPPDGRPIGGGARCRITASEVRVLCLCVAVNGCYGALSNFCVLLCGKHTQPHTHTQADSPSNMPASTEIKYPLPRACSSSAASTAAGLHTHVRTHRTSSDPAYL